MHIEPCYVCSSTMRGGGNLCFVCMSYVLIGLNWNCATCCTFSDTMCFDHANEPEVVYNLRNMDRVDYRELSDEDNDSDGVVANDEEVESLDEDDEEDVNEDDRSVGGDEDNGSENGDEDGPHDIRMNREEEYGNMDDGYFDDGVDKESKPDYDPDLGCRICNDTVDPAYHNVEEERGLGNYSTPYCEVCNRNRRTPGMIHCCGFWQSEECCICENNGEN